MTGFVSVRIIEYQQGEADQIRSVQIKLTFFGNSVGSVCDGINKYDGVDECE